MPTAKAKYMGDGSGERIPDFSNQLRENLREFFPDRSAESDPVWGDPADAFVEEVLGEAWDAKSTLHSQSYESTKGDVRAELEDFFKTLHVMRHKLENLSPDADRMLSVAADPKGCADQIAKLLGSERPALERAAQMGKAKKPREKQHFVAVELALRVLRVLQRHDIRAAATADPVFGYRSDAVRILKLIGDDLGVVLTEITWRDTILEAKQQAPDLQ